MNIDALFCDGTGNYVIPPEPKKNEKIRLRFRTAKDDVDQVFLLVGEQSYEMEKKETRGIFDYYEMEWQLGEKEFHYGFQVSKGGEVKYFNRCGVSGNREEFYSFMITPGFSTPDWAKGAVMYQIFVDRFYNGDRTNDVETGEYAYIGEHSVRVEDWSKYPAFMGVREFYGGDLKGVLEKIDYLQELGVEAVYFNPLFVSPSNHKYDIQDYDFIDPHYGVKTAERCCRMDVWITARRQNIRFGRQIERILRRAMHFLQNLCRNSIDGGSRSLSTVCSITVVPLINGWTESGSTRSRRGMGKVHTSQRTVITTVSSGFSKKSGRTIIITMAGGGTIPCQNSIMKVPRNYRNIF